MISLLVLHHFVGIGINTTPSLEHKIFFLKKYHTPERNDYASYMKITNGILPDDTLYIKRVVGVPGDVITHKDGYVYINGESFGQLQSQTEQGQALSHGCEGEIPEGFYFMHSSHIDSFDSRYAQIGLIHESEIVASAYPLW